MKFLKSFLAISLCFATVFMSGCLKEKNDKTYTDDDFPLMVDTDISVLDCFLYTGEFVEDGSFENKENVAAVKVKNNSAKDIQLARIYVLTSEKELLFEATTLLAGATMTVLEKTGQTLGDTEEIKDLRVENRVDFSTKVSLREKQFLIQANNKTINIKNISTTDCESEIYVYYKKKDDAGNYFGGITFRTKASGLKVDEIQQLPAPHFIVGNSEVVFVDYAG